MGSADMFVPSGFIMGRSSCTSFLSAAVLVCLVGVGCAITDKEREVAIAAREMSASTTNCKTHPSDHLSSVLCQL